MHGGTRWCFEFILLAINPLSHGRLITRGVRGAPRTVFHYIGAAYSYIISLPFVSKSLSPTPRSESLYYASGLAWRQMADG